MQEEGLRERKKRAMRQHISDVATRLFAQGGFDTVTVEDVARAADVSKMTVFKYFPRKEDLVLDREEELVTLLRDAARSGPPLQALETLFVTLAEQGHPILAAIAGGPPFWALIRSSAALMARWGGMVERVEAEIAAALVAHEQMANDTATVLACQITATWRAVANEGLRRVEAGEALDAIRARQVELLRAGFGRLSARPATTS